MVVDDLKNKVFNKCVELHIESGKPVGSKLLQKKFFKNLADSTVRLYLNKLVKEKLLENVNDYCGRIPTDYGWRCFFDWNFDNVNLDLDNLKIAKRKNLFEKTVFLSKSFRIYYIIKEKDKYILEGGLENILGNDEFQKRESILSFAVFLKKIKQSLDELIKRNNKDRIILYIGQELPIKFKGCELFSFVAKKSHNKTFCFLTLKRINYPSLVKLIDILLK